MLCSFIFLQNIERSWKEQLGHSKAMVQETPPAYISQLDWKLCLEHMGKHIKTLHQPYLYIILWVTFCNNFNMKVTRIYAPGTDSLLQIRIVLHVYIQIPFEIANFTSICHLGLCLQGTTTFDREFLKSLNYYDETQRREVWGKCHVASPDQIVNNDKYRLIHMLFSSGFSSDNRVEKSNWGTIKQWSKKLPQLRAWTTQ